MAEVTEAPQQVECPICSHMVRVSEGMCLHCGSLVPETVLEEWRIHAEKEEA